MSELEEYEYISTVTGSGYADKWLDEGFENWVTGHPMGDPGLGLQLILRRKISKEGHTDPRTLPDDIKRKLLVIRDALVRCDHFNNDIDEAYHALYSIADPEFISYTPWDTLEK